MESDLCNAAMQGDEHAVAKLLGDGENPNGTWDRERAAAIHREIHGIGVPMEPFGSDVTKDAIERMNRSPEAPYAHEIPIFCAAFSGSVRCVELMIDAGANITTRDWSQSTPIFYAHDVTMIQLLQRLGLDIESRDWLDYTPLMALPAGSFDQSTEDDWQQMELKQARSLIEAGANVNATHDRGVTVFMGALGSMERHTELLRLLLDAGADPHAITELGCNAFHAAIDVTGPDANSEESVRETLALLHDLGVNINQISNAGDTPLDKAWIWGTGTENEVLIELGAKRASEIRDLSE